MQDLRERLIRIEERLNNISGDVDQLARRDREHETAVRELTDGMRVAMEHQAREFRATMKEQAEAFQKALEKVSESFVKKDEWSFWKSLLQWAVIGLITLAVASFRTGGTGPR